nr:IS66 family transposase [Glaciecola punicea]
MDNNYAERAIKPFAISVNPVLQRYLHVTASV